MTSRLRSTGRRAAIGSVAAAATLAVLVGPGAATSATAADSGRSGATQLGAMQRDLGLTSAGAAQRLAAERSAAAVDTKVRASAGSTYAGSWFDASTGSLHVAVTSAASATRARAQGATVVTASRSLKQLDSFTARLDATTAPTSVAGWYTDVARNRLVVSGRDAADATSFADEAGVPASAVTFRTERQMPQPLAQGGDAYVIDGTSRCSIGFAVNGGFVSAGHCGSTGSTTTQPTGTFAGSSFPGNDYSFVRTSATITGTVNDYAGGSIAVKGSTEAPIGSSICRSGSTTGWRCGTISARNSTVRYQEGSVTGLVRTNVCAEPGDSGGSAISGSQAQGVTSGGSGDCTSGGTTYFQPVNEILGAYGLTLKTS